MKINIFFIFYGAVCVDIVWALSYLTVRSPLNSISGRGEFTISVIISAAPTENGASVRTGS